MSLKTTIIAFVFLFIGSPALGQRVIRGIVLDGETGTLVPSGDTVGLRNAITSLLSDDELRMRFGEAGRARMQREFSVDVMVDRHVDLYESVIRGQRDQG